MKELKMNAWLARDEIRGEDNSTLYIGNQKPRRICEDMPGYGSWVDFGDFIHLPNESFPEITWEDEPMEVEVIVRLKQK